MFSISAWLLINTGEKGVVSPVWQVLRVQVKAAKTLLIFTTAPANAPDAASRPVKGTVRLDLSTNSTDDRSAIHHRGLWMIIYSMTDYIQCMPPENGRGYLPTANETGKLFPAG